MDDGRAAKFRAAILRRFPERHVHLRSPSEVRSFVVTTRDQLLACAGAAALVVWTLAATASFAWSFIGAASQEDAAARTQAYYERLIADRQARLNAAVARLTSSAGSIDGLARAVSERHAALAMLLSGLKGGSRAALAPLSAPALQGRSPSDTLRGVETDQARMAAAAEGFAHDRADRLRLALHLAGLDPASYAGRVSDGQGLGGPLIEAKDPRALAAVLDVDVGFAARIQRAARDLNAVRSLDEEARKLPLAEPVADPVRSSPFGARIDPFTRQGAFHPGQDFSGAANSAIRATAPGVVSFTGQRTGYGNVVEIDHGGGFKTRYAHLQSIGVSMGQRVALGERIGGMGGTGRSTGVHLHYEVWQNGRVQDPARFLRAGDYVQQNDQ